MDGVGRGGEFHPRLRTGLCVRQPPGRAPNLTDARLWPRTRDARAILGLASRSWAPRGVGELGGPGDGRDAVAGTGRQRQRAVESSREQQRAKQSAKQRAKQRAPDAEGSRACVERRRDGSRGTGAAARG